MKHLQTIKKKQGNWRWNRTIWPAWTRSHLQTPLPWRIIIMGTHCTRIRNFESTYRCRRFRNSDSNNNRLQIMVYRREKGKFHHKLPCIQRSRNRHRSVRLDVMRTQTRWQTVSTKYFKKKPKRNQNQHTKTLWRYMRPGVPHFVVTPRNCIAIGAHFYNTTQAYATLHSMIAEHYLGLHATNTEHLSSFLIWFKLLRRYEDTSLYMKQNRCKQTGM